MATPQTKNGYTKIANEIAEALSKTQLSGYESRVLWVIWRKTYGWSKKEDWISLSQFQEATGLQNSHISRTLKKLVQKNIITKNGNQYSFQKSYQKWYVELPKMVRPITKNGKSLSTKKLPKMVSTKETKETITKETKQKKGTPAQIMRAFILSVRTEDAAFIAILDWLKQRGVSEVAGRQELNRFVDYWTEKNKTGTKERWELEKTFEVKRRLATWFGRVKDFNKNTGGKNYDE